MPMASKKIHDQFKHIATCTQLDFILTTSLRSISSHTKILSGKDDWFSIYIEPALGGTDRWSMDPFPLPQHIHTFAKIVISKKKLNCNITNFLQLPIKLLKA